MKFKVLIFSFFFLTLNLISQTPVAVGNGSYASDVPGGTAYQTANIDTVTLYTNGTVTGPKPSSDWWTSLLTTRYSQALWAHPLQVTANASGVKLFMPNTWVNGLMQATAGIQISGSNFAPSAANVKNWGDWTVTWSMPEGAKNWDVTIGQGLPYIWIESTMMDMSLTMDISAAYFDDAGTVLTGSYTSNHIGFTSAGKHYGVFTPPATVFTLTGSKLSIRFGSTNSYLIVAGMPQSTSLSYFDTYAKAIPRDSKVSWSYDKIKGEVASQWVLTTAALRGSEPKLIQGFIPHQYKHNTSLSFNGLTYPTARGLLKACTGTNFNIPWKFIGIPTRLPAPEALGLSNDFDKIRMSNYITEFANNDYSVAGYPNMFMIDPRATYWSGKKLQMYATVLSEAVAMNHPDVAILSNWLRTELVNWLTYTPGEPERFFAMRPGFGALIGYWQDFASDRLIDVHFHYGMFLYASAILGSIDRDFLTKYGPMARVVAKTIAEWDRSSTQFPFMRSLDIWEGHSWAVGGWDLDADYGNNQESSSEAMNFWTGMFLLGNLMQDSAMEATAAFGYANESRAMQEYYVDWDKDTYGAANTKPVVGILSGGKFAYTTFFGSEPFKPHFIQKIPMTTGSYYQSESPAGALAEWNGMKAILSGEIETWSAQDFWAEYANVLLKWTSLFDPEYAVSKYEQLWLNNNRIAHDKFDSPDGYFYIHANRQLGKRCFDMNMDNPTGAVFYNPQLLKYTYMVYNPTAFSQNVNVYSNMDLIGQIPVAAYTYKSVNTLGADMPLKAVGSTPSNNAANVIDSTKKISITFTSNMSGSSVAANAGITGPGVSGLTYFSGDGTKTITLQITGSLQSNNLYTVTISSAAQAAAGGSLISNYQFSFTAVFSPPPPPLTILSENPSMGDMAVTLSVTNLSFTFSTLMDGQTLLENTAIYGPGVGALSYMSGSSTASLKLKIAGALEAGQTYTVFISSNLQGENGSRLASNIIYTFQTATPGGELLIDDYSSTNPDLGTQTWTGQQGFIPGATGEYAWIFCDSQAGDVRYSFSPDVNGSTYANLQFNIRHYANNLPATSLLTVTINDGADRSLPLSNYLPALTAAMQTVTIPLSSFPGLVKTSIKSIRIRQSATGAGCFGVALDNWKLSGGVAGPATTNALRLVQSSPSNLAVSVAVNISNLTLVFSSNMNGLSVLSNTLISGAGAPALSYLSGSGTPIIRLALSASLSGNTLYSVTVNSNSRGTDGSPMLSNGSFSFTTASLPVPAPAAPGSFSAVLGGVGIAILNWSEVSNANGYSIYLSTNSNKPGAAAYTLTAPRSNLTVSNLASGSVYTFWLNAYNAGGASPDVLRSLSTPNLLRLVQSTPSNLSTVSVAATSNITLVFSGNMNGLSVLSNTVISGAGAPALSYLSGSGTSNIVLSLGASLSGSTLYSVTVNSNSKGVDGSLLVSNATFTFTTASLPPPAPAAPAGFSAMLGGVGVVILNWSEVSNALGYSIFLSTNTNKPGAAAYTLTAPRSNLTVSNLASGSVFTFWINASNAGGVSPDAVTSISTPSLLMLVQSTPSNLSTVSALSTSNLSLVFNSNMNGLSVLSNTAISGPGSPFLSYLSGSSTTTIQLRINGALLGGSVYTVTVNSNSKSTNGLNLISNYAFTFTTAVIPPPPPAVPAGFTASLTSNDQISLSWTGVSNATVYLIYVSTDTVKPSLAAYTLASSNIGLTLSNVLAGSTYTIWLSASNAGGASIDALASVNIAADEPKADSWEGLRVIDSGAGLGDIIFAVYTVSDEARLEIYSILGDLIWKSENVSCKDLRTPGLKQVLLQIPWPADDRQNTASGTYIAVIREDGKVNRKNLSNLVVK